MTKVALLLSLSLTASTALAQSLRVSGMPTGAPLTVTARASESALVIDVALDPEWHLYARDVGGGQPVTAELDLDQAFEATGELEAPGDAHGQIVGEAQLVLPLRRVTVGQELTATLSFQVCDALECLAPITLTLAGEVAPLRVLLVVAQEDERAGRIASWLRERAFKTDVTTYAAVTLAECDAHDVVVADSHYFQKHGVGRATIHAFPRTASPIVAVGFIGTELIEAHGIALASGYI